MKMRMILSMALVMAMTATAWAAIPAPPVNQNLGIPDTLFGQMAEADCRGCHGATPPAGIPVDTTDLRDRHHLLSRENGGTGLIPAGTAAPNGVVGNRYECLSCHSMTINPQTGQTETTVVRDCLACHQVGAAGGTVHHATPAALARDCRACHSSLVTNFNDGHMIPTYTPSLVTPYPSTKAGVLNGPGTCSSCHRGGSIEPLGTAPILDPDSGVMVYNNAVLHHNTGLGANCNWCHDSSNQGLAIRGCQSCHGLVSLHSIQYDNTGNGVVPGQMAPGYGHIGNQADCAGCHGNVGASSAAPMGPTVPSISSMSSSIVLEGEATELTILGASFINTNLGTRMTSRIVLTDADGTKFDLTPTSVLSGEIKVTIPSYLKVGNYKVTAAKFATHSNPVSLQVIPQFAVASAQAAGNTVTITGSGFSGHLDAINSGTYVAATLVEQIGNGRNARERAVRVNGTVKSWSNEKIVVEFPSAPGQVEVASIFGTVVADVAVATAPAAPAPAPERGKEKDNSNAKRK